jgi:hypothetical protein
MCKSYPRMQDAFAGIKEKLKRSHQNVLNLQAEVNRFFEESRYPVLPQDDVKLLAEAIKYHSQRDIPLRFSVLAGEIAHHLRSCLDHIVWQFSSDLYRIDYPQRIEFPILEARPIDKDSVKRYEGKIKGITNPGVLDAIERLQPYNAANPVESPLLVVHNMDITDKHRELVLCLSTGALEIPHDVVGGVVAKLRTSYQQGIMDPTLESRLKREMQNHAKIVPTISFPNFRGREFEAVVMAMMELNNEIVQIVAQFDRFLLH